MTGWIRRLITSLFYRLTSSHYRLVLESGLFDRDYYLRNNPDIAANGLDPLAHYLKQGFRENRRPGMLFDPGFYLSQVHQRDEDSENPLVHYLEQGKERGLSPNVFVDPDYYRLVNGSSAGSKTDALSHFLDKDEPHPPGCSPSPYFDAHFYTTTYKDYRKHRDNPAAAYLHFLHASEKENRQPSSYFDPPHYLDKNPRLVELGLNPFSHYGTYGAAERKSPSPLFDPDYYAAAYGISDCDDLFAHFLRTSLQEDRQPCSWFDPAFYRETYLGESEDSLVPLKHFLEKGLKKRHYPNRRVARLSEKPLISILVPVYNVKHYHLNNCIRSVLYQSYPHWELCLVDDCSTDPAILPLLKTWAAADSRIKIDSLAVNSGISTTTNTAARHASGDYLLLLDNDDELAPEALETLATFINEHPSDLYYSDENLIGDDGAQLNVFRKPAFNRELLLCHNYVTHCVCTTKALYEKVGGCAAELDGAQDHDLFLKLSEASGRAVHIPAILYHWRAAATSTSINHDAKQYASEAGRTAVNNALARSGEAGEVHDTDYKFYYRAERLIAQDLSVTLVVDWERSEDTIADWLTEVLESAGHAVAQLLIVLPYQPDQDFAGIISRATGLDVICKNVPPHLGPPAKLGLVRSMISTDLVTFIGGELNIESRGWLAALVEYGQYPEYGIICGSVEYPSDYYDTVTQLPHYGSTSPIYYKQFLTNASVFMNGRHCAQQVLAPGSDLFLVRNDLLQADKSIDSDEFPFLFSLVDFSFRLHLSGKKNIYTPSCRAATDIDEITRGHKWSLDELQEEKLRFQSNWFQLLAQGDPFYSLNIVADEGLSVAEFQSWMSGEQPADFVEDVTYSFIQSSCDSHRLSLNLQACIHARSARVDRI